MYEFWLVVVVQLPSGDYGLLQHGLLRCGLPRTDPTGDKDVEIIVEYILSWRVQYLFLVGTHLDRARTKFD